MQTALSRIWTRHVDSISYDDKPYTKRVSKHTADELIDWF